MVAAMDGAPAQLQPSPAGKSAPAQDLRGAYTPPAHLSPLQQIPTASVVQGSPPEQPSTPSAEFSGPNMAVQQPNSMHAAVAPAATPLQTPMSPVDAAPRGRPSRKTALAAKSFFAKLGDAEQGLTVEDDNGFGLPKRPKSTQADAVNGSGRPRRSAVQKHPFAGSNQMPEGPARAPLQPADLRGGGAVAAAGGAPAAMAAAQSSVSATASRPAAAGSAAPGEPAAAAAADAGGEGARRSRQAKKQFQDEVTEVAKPRQPPALSAAAAAAALPGYDVLFGCPKCRYAKNGCGVCRANPSITRDKGLRWRPEAGRPQTGIEEAPTFRPTEEEFKDPLAYINSCRPAGERCGIVCIVPPPSFKPPFALEKGTNGQSADSFRFAIRKQLTSHLCMRLPNKQTGKQATRRGYGATVHAEGEEEDEFGFVTLDKRHTLRSYAAYADWVKAVHFSNTSPQKAPPATPSNQSAKRRRLHTYSGPAPSVDQIEAEFWRIVETPDAVYESLYGQDLDSGHHGSGFPLPPFRAALLRAHLAAQERSKPKAVSAAAAAPATAAKEPTNGLAPDAGAANQVRPEETEAHYSTHPWNINNLPRHRGSTLRYLAGDELITGVQVPWLYVGSVLSAFCWHVEDHALYSVNYHHLGAPKVWYGVPAHASESLEEAIRDAVPHLVDPTPNLLYQLVTMVSPRQLKARGVPVYRLVHHENSFVVTYPNAFHSGFNTGFNCAEAVNFGPPDWLPYGTDRAEKYRKDWKPLTLSHDALLVTLVTAARAAAQAAAERGEDLRSAPLPSHSVAAEPVPPELDEAVKKAELAIDAQAAAGGAHGQKPRAVPGGTPAQHAAFAFSAGMANGTESHESGSGAQPVKREEQPAEQSKPSSAPHAQVEAGAPGSVPACAAELQPAAAELSASEARAAAARAKAAGMALRRARKEGASAAALFAGQRNFPHGVVGTDTLVGGHLGQLDPVHVEDAPPEGIRLAAGELTLRAAEERRRIAVGSADGPLPIQMMNGAPGARSADGCHTDTTDVDCEVCKTDLWLSAVCTPAAPGRAVCPEHAAHLPGPRHQRVLLCRHTPDDLDVLVREAVEHVGGAKEAVKFAKQRHVLWKARRPAVKKIGPMAAPVVTALGEEVKPLPAFAAGGPMPDPKLPSLQVLDGHCYDPVEVAAAAKAASPSDREDSPAVGGVGDDDDEPDYEPEAEDASDDDDPVPGRAAARGAEGEGEPKKRGRRGKAALTEEAPRVKRKYVRRKPLPPRKNSRGAAAALSPVVQHLPPSPAGGSQPALPQHVTHQSPVQHAAQQSSRLQMPQQPMSPPQLYIPNIIPQQHQPHPHQQQQMVSLQHLTPVQISQQQQRLQQQQQQHLHQPVVRVQQAVHPHLQQPPRQPPTLQQWAAQAAISPVEPGTLLPHAGTPNGSPGSGKPQQKLQFKRPDPAAAEAAAMGPVGDRRQRKPRKLLYEKEGDYEEELPEFKKLRSEPDEAAAEHSGLPPSGPSHPQVVITQSLHSRS